MSGIGCWHVTTERGERYGVAATGKREALGMVQDRLVDTLVDDRPVGATRVGSWAGVPYGTVLHYGAA